MHFHGGGPSYTLKAILYTAYHYLIGLRITLRMANHVIVLNNDEEKRVTKFLGIKNVLYFPSTVALDSINNNLIYNKKIVTAGRKSKLHNIDKIKIPNNWSFEAIEWVNRKQLLEKFRNSSLYLHLYTKNEGSPITLIEALSQGVPVIAFDKEGIRDAVKDNYNGWLVNNIKQFNEKLGQIDQYNLIDIKNNCINTVKDRFIDEKYFPQLIAIYNSLIN